MIKAPIAATRTAPAATSLALAARGCGAGDARSTRNSMEVFRASVTHTQIIASPIRHHSVDDIRNRNPAAIARIVAMAWMRALCCVLTNIARPRKAYPKLCKRLVR